MELSNNVFEDLVWKGELGIPVTYVISAHGWIDKEKVESKVPVLAPGFQLVFYQPHGDLLSLSTSIQSQIGKSGFISHVKDIHEIIEAPNQIYQPARRRQQYIDYSNSSYAYELQSDDRGTFSSGVACYWSNDEREWLNTNHRQWTGYVLFNLDKAKGVVQFADVVTQIMTWHHARYGVNSPYFAQIHCLFCREIFDRTNPEKPQPTTVLNEYRRKKRYALKPKTGGKSWVGPRPAGEMFIPPFPLPASTSRVKTLKVKVKTSKRATHKQKHII
jgi:hypothetical protein